MNKKYLIAALIALVICLAIAAHCACSITGDKPVTIYNQPGPDSTMETESPPNTKAQKESEPEKDFNFLKFWSIVGAGGIIVLIFLWATGNLHPAKKYNHHE